MSILFDNMPLTTNRKQSILQLEQSMDEFKKACADLERILYDIQKKEIPISPIDITWLVQIQNASHSASDLVSEFLGILDIKEDIQFEEKWNDKKTYFLNLYKNSNRVE